MFAFEFGIDQTEDMLAMARATAGLANIRIIKDLSNIDRVILGTWDPASV
jgi:methylase of polypeptide subunit release factors